MGAISRKGAPRSSSPRMTREGNDRRTFPRLATQNLGRATLGPRATARVSSVPRRRAMGLDGGTIISRSDILRGQSWDVANADGGASTSSRAASSPPGRSTPVVDARIRRERRRARWSHCALSGEPCANRSCAAASAGCATARRSSSTRWPGRDLRFREVHVRVRKQDERILGERRVARAIAAGFLPGPPQGRRGRAEGGGSEEDRTGGRGRDPEKKRAGV